MQNLMTISGRVTLSGVVGVVERMTRSQLVQIACIAIAMVMPELFHVHELLSGGFQVLCLVAGRCARRG